ncbi:unnamed protein product [Symbiodinium sp. CCMP2592]|nr:unnamed protein product [Symbiodinium sp. CCMP2592]
MPSKCAGFEDPAFGPARDCIFAKDGHGGRANVMKTSNGGHCVFCSIPALGRALESPAGKRNVVRQLKHWREAGSPTYKFALAHSSLVVLEPAELLWMRFCAGERAKFDVKSSWLHKKTKRLTHFVLGRPALRTPKLSMSAEKFVRHCRYSRNRYYFPDDFPRNNHWIELVGKDVLYMNDYGKEKLTKWERAIFKFKWSWSTTMRTHRRVWWRARRKIRALLRSNRRRRHPPYEPLVAWALENKLIKPTRSTTKRKYQKLLDECASGNGLEDAGAATDTDGSQGQSNTIELFAGPRRQVLVDAMMRESEGSRVQSIRSALPPLSPAAAAKMLRSQMMQTPKQKLPAEEFAKRLQEAERGQSTSKKLVAVVTRWGTASTLKNFAQPSDPLWQVMVEHVDGPGATGSFGFHLMATLQEALVHHPNPEARDLRGLRKHIKVIVLNGAPYPDTREETRAPWVPSMYVAGNTPHAVFEVIRLVMEEKVRQNLLTQVPPKLHVSWQLGKPPAEPLPSPWKSVDDHRPVWNQFEVQPPEAPQIRKHLKGNLEQTSEKPLKFRLVLHEGIAAFAKAFEDADIRLEAPYLGFPNIKGRILHNLGADDGSIRRVRRVLHEVLGSRPIQLEADFPDCGNAFTTWLQEQPSVALI